MKLYKLFYLVSTIMFLSACQTDDEMIEPDPELEILGITAEIGNGAKILTRADVFKSTSVGRSTFSSGDKIVFTKIQRTKNGEIIPIDKFTYSDVRYLYNGTNWKRTETTPQNEKIYWSDGSNDHTFIGYCLPNATDYPWTHSNEIYYGQLRTIDFRTVGNTGIAAEDLLLTYSDTTKAETGGLTTKVYLTHGLSNVCVVVNIKEYAASSSAVDTKVVVSDMIIGEQPTKFTWDANSANLVADTDPANQNLTLWCPNSDGDGSGQTKTFSFYGLTVPHTAKVPFQFKVKYDPNDTETKTYKGEFSSVAFQSGKCTTLNITLNHRDEQMHLNVDYSDWKYVATPDLGELVKKSTYMEMTIDNVSTHFDNGLTIDNATWLYIDHNDEDKVKDVYGNDGNLEHPYVIKSAAQLLSFAKEVNNGYSFSGDYIRLDADITMQASTAKTNVESETSTVKPVAWIGIGEDGKPFNGTFLGGDRYINRLYGKPLFINLGAQAVVEQLHIAPIGTITGGGALAETNVGTIGGCKVVEDVTLSTDGEAGALVGKNIKTENSIGTIYACYHIGNATIVRTDKTTGTAGLVGSNEGTIVGCYHAGDTFTIANTNTGTINCPEATSIYQIQQKDFVEALNKKLTEWNLETKFQFVHNSASYPTVTKGTTKQ